MIFFISHATEDKEDFVNPLAIALKDAGFKVWYDKFEMRVGDQLRRKIDQGLRDATYGLVIFSESFFKKQWPQYELDGLLTREMSGRKKILPIWHKVTKDDVEKYSPSLTGKIAFNTSIHSLADIVEGLIELFKFEQNCPEKSQI